MIRGGERASLCKGMYNILIRLTPTVMYSRISRDPCTVTVALIMINENNKSVQIGFGIRIQLIIFKLFSSVRFTWRYFSLCFMIDFVS